MWDLCLMQCVGFFSSGRYLSFFWVRKNHFSSKWICNSKIHIFYVGRTYQSEKVLGVCHVCLGGGTWEGEMGEKGGVDEENPHNSATHKFMISLAPFFPKRGSFIKASLRLPLRLALCEGHVHCLLPLPCLLLVCTTLVCVLFVATPMSTISVYYFSMCIRECDWDSMHRTLLGPWVVGSYGRTWEE